MPIGWYLNYKLQLKRCKNLIELISTDPQSCHWRSWGSLCWDIFRGVAKHRRMVSSQCRSWESRYCSRYIAVVPGRWAALQRKGGKHWWPSSSRVSNTLMTLLGRVSNTHGRLNKIGDILKVIFSNVFVMIKCLNFYLNFYWKMFLWIWSDHNLHDIIAQLSLHVQSRDVTLIIRSTINYLSHAVPSLHAPYKPLTPLWPWSQYLSHAVPSLHAPYKPLTPLWPWSQYLSHAVPSLHAPYKPLTPLWPWSQYLSHAVLSLHAPYKSLTPLWPWSQYLSHAVLSLHAPYKPLTPLWPWSQYLSHAVPSLHAPYKPLTPLWPWSQYLSHAVPSLHAPYKPLTPLWLWSQYLSHAVPSLHAP